jgi:hypothetical protein
MTARKTIVMRIQERDGQRYIDLRPWTINTDPEGKLGYLIPIDGQDDATIANLVREYAEQVIADNISELERLLTRPSTKKGK